MNKKKDFVELTSDEIKLLSIELLKSVHNYCLKNNLKYSLFYGTMLGAIRHKGFIPWDDDIDIAMPRGDYEYFIKNFHDNNCYVVSCKYDKNYYLPWAKVCDKKTIKIESTSHKINYGVNIDIFPIDYVDNFNNFIKKRKRISFLAKKLSISNNKANWRTCNPKKLASSLLTLFLKPFSNCYAKKIDLAFNAGEKTNFTTTNCFFQTDERYFYKSPIFNDLIEVDFENNKFLCSADYDVLLKTSYGEYMLLPPIEKQVTHHDFVAYYLK